MHVQRVENFQELIRAWCECVDQRVLTPYRRGECDLEMLALVQDLGRCRNKKGARLDQKQNV